MIEQNLSLNKKIKRSIECWIFDRVQGCFLLLRCPETEKHKEYWQPVTGGIENYESQHSACVREVKEETGLRVHSDEITKLIDTFKVYSDKIELHKTVFVVVLSDMEVVISDEHIGFKWVKPEMVDQMLLWGSNKSTYESVITFLNLKG